MNRYGKYDDDRKRNKTRTDFKHTDKLHSNQHQRSSNGNGKHRDDKEEYDDYYGSSHKRTVNSRSRSRSRSSSRVGSDRSSSNHSSNKLQRNSISKLDESSVINGSSQTIASFSNNMISRAFNPGNPSRTIMLRQLPLQMEDHELRSEFNALGILIKDVRLVKNRDTGQSRGFAFVEFNNVEDAQHWMNNTLGWVVFSNYPKNRVQLFYSHSGEENNSFRADKSNLSTDWDCAKCGIKNFKRRDRCFKCSITREESERRSGGDGYDHVGNTPCNTILLRGLDALTTEYTVLDILNRFTNNCIFIKNCHIARDVLTNVSCGFAFIELNSIQDSTNLLQFLQPNFEVEGKQITASFSKNSYRTALTQIEMASRMTYQPLNNDINTTYSSHHQPNNKVNQTDQANSAASIAQAALANMHKKQELSLYMTNHLKQQKMIGSEGGALAPDSTPSIDTSVGANLQMLAKQVDMLANKVYPPPDMSTFTYDETSGYYYDYTTGFYYDSTSQYYFNPLTQQYMYWDQSKFTYVSVNSGSAATETAAATATATATPVSAGSTESIAPVSADANAMAAEEKSNKPTKPITKTAAQIAKDMERWAQSQNKKKEIVKKPVQPATVVVSTPKAELTNVRPLAIVKELNENSNKKEAVSEQMSTPSDDAKKVLIKSATVNYENEKTESNDSDTTSTTTPANNSSSCEAKKNETVKEDETKVTTVATNQVTTFNEASLIDLNKMACLLCKRRFDSVDILNKHIAKSDLHKKNLENYKKEHFNAENSLPTEESNKACTQSESDSLLAALQYRDRAKERRKKYGTPEPPSPTFSSSSTAYKSKIREYEEPSSVTSSGGMIGNSESVASKLMKKMGWNEGSGIGKNLQGISAPIEATMRQKGAGLGATSYEMDPNDSYKDAARKSARARFESLN